MKILRLLLIPFSLVYGGILLLRHLLYDRGLLKSTKFDKPVIVIGNLVVGGAGKTPMAEYLIRLLSNNYRIATLSRGYGRKTKGYLIVEESSTATEAGDEPLQFKRKFPTITVADCENRVIGLTKLMPDHDLFILDDAFQHRALKAGISILLFDFSSLSETKFLLPSGNYRDLFLRRHQADIVVVTKSPEILNEDERKRALEQLNLKANKPVYFSCIRYADPIALLTDTQIYDRSNRKKVIAISGIANPKPFLKYLSSNSELLDAIIFPDHHLFSAKDIRDIVKVWKGFHQDVALVTTEKDAMRLQQPDLLPLLVGLPLYYIPIQAGFHQDDERRFNELIKSKVLNILHDKNKTIKQH